MITMNDIARLSGVSRATVSAVLNSKPGVSEKTRNRVLAVLREQDYSSRRIAQSLMGEYSRMIMMVLRDIRNPYSSEVIAEVSRVAREKGYLMIFHSTQEDLEEEIKGVNLFKNNYLSGMIIFPIQECDNHRHIEQAVQTGKPIITIGRLPGIQTHCIWVDHKTGSRRATEHLITMGHRRISCLAGPTSSSGAKERIMGFVEGLLDQQVPFHDSMVIRGVASSQDGYEAALKLLSKSEARPTALLCFNDLVAVGVYKAAHELGMRIPDDVSVIGCDDIEIAAVMGPPLTTVATFPKRIGCLAAETLFRHIASELKGQTVEEILEPHLMIRDSVRQLA